MKIMTSRRLLYTSSSASIQKYVLPKLEYSYDALEPFISRDIMELHHQKHHQTYVNNLNSILEEIETAKSMGDLSKEVSLGDKLRFNGGGHINHSIFWNNLAPNGAGGGGNPSSELLLAINNEYGSFEAFKTEFQNKAVGVQGSGWAWLALDNATKELHVVTTPNQDPVSLYGFSPLLGIDVWEHAYYLQYRNVRPDYIKNFWEIVNWHDVERRFHAFHTKSE